jgi:hypothetical protein
MEQEDINYLIGKASRTNVTPLYLSFRGLTFLQPYELRGLENIRGFDSFLNQPALLPPEISDLKNLTVLNNINYSGQMVK